MALAHASKLIADAQSGIEIGTSERRLCVQYLQATRPELTNQQVAEIFSVSERTIRMDRLKLREQKAKFLKDELAKDLSLVIADIAMDFEKQVGDLEKSKGQARLGSRSYVDHCNAIFSMRLNMVKAFQDIGYLPKNLGNMTVDKFEYKATILKDGAAVTRTVDLNFDSKIDDGPIIDADFEDVGRPELPAKPPEQAVVSVGESS